MKTKIFALLLSLILLPYGMRAQDSDEGYTINYKAETITIAEGYEVYTAETDGEQILSGGSITAYIGQSLYIQQTDASERTAIPIPQRPQAPNISSVSIDYDGEKLSFPPNLTATTLEYATEQTNPEWKDVPIGAALSEMGWTGDSQVFYYFRTAADSDSFASASTTNYVEVKARPSAPSFSPTVTKTANSITISPIDAEKEYRIYQSNTTPSNWGTLNAETDGSYTWNNLQSGTKYTIETRTPADDYINKTFASHPASITVTTKSDTELGNLTISGNTGINEGAFQYGDAITIAFTPQRKEVDTKALTENTATLTYTPDEGEAIQLAEATAGEDGSFKLTYDTKKKELPIGENLSLTVSYGGSGELNPVEKELTVTLEQATLKNRPTLSGNFVYGETITANYTKQDDEVVSYQWYRGSKKISGATGTTYTLTKEDIGKRIYLRVSSDDGWHYGASQSDEKEVTKASLTEDAIEITSSEATIELGSEGAILTAVITGIKDANDADNWDWNSSDESIVKVEKLNAEEATPRSTDNTIESKARVTPVSTGTATITVTYSSDTYNEIKKEYKITVTDKEESEEPETPVIPDYPKYYNIMVEECEGATVETSSNVVREGTSVTFTIDIAEGYTAENMTVKVKRSLFGYTETIEPNEEGIYEVKNIYTDIYVTIDGVEEETPTGIEDIEGAKVYTKEGSIYVYTPTEEQVTIISMSGAVLKNEKQTGLKQYSGLNRGVYILCIGEERVKVRN